MPTLDYEAPIPRATSGLATAALLILPLVAFGAAFICSIKWISEPFGVFEVEDFIVFAGAPVVVLVAGTVWGVTAHKRRLIWPLSLLVVGWFVLMLCWSIDSLVPYFSEPWNTGWKR